MPCKKNKQTYMTKNLLKDELFQFINGLDTDEIGVFLADRIKENSQHCKTLIKYATMFNASLTYTLQISIKHKNLACMIECIRNGADIHHRELGNTYVHITTIENNINLLKFFLSKDIDIHLKNDNGYTASNLALVFKHYE